MKHINLLMLDKTFIFDSNFLSKESVKNYLGLEDLKSQELLTINKLCKLLKKEKCNHNLFENYYLNHQIAQVEGKFDLLKIGTKSIINIELESQNSDNFTLLKQLEKNYYYLSFLKKKVHCYAFINTHFYTKIFYYKKNTKTLQEVEISHLSHILERMEDDSEEIFDENNKLILNLT